MSAKPPPPPPSRPAKTAPPPAGPKVPPPPSGPKTTDLDMYSVRTLAGMWECSVDFIYDLIAKGELATVPLSIHGRAKTRITASAAAEFIAKRTSKRAA